MGLVGRVGAFTRGVAVSAWSQHERRVNLARTVRPVPPTTPVLASAAQTVAETPAAPPLVSTPVPNAIDATSTATNDSVVYARATEWTNVRAERNLEAPVIGVIQPDSVVEIVEVRGAWRRVSTTGLAGWADYRHFAADSTRRRKG